jgi:hypothetical protein
MGITINHVLRNLGKKRKKGKKGRGNEKSLSMYELQTMVIGWMGCCGDNGYLPNITNKLLGVPE